MRLAFTGGAAPAPVRVQEELVALAGDRVRNQAAAGIMAAVALRTAPKRAAYMQEVRLTASLATMTQATATVSREGE